MRKFLTVTIIAALACGAWGQSKFGSIEVGGAYAGGSGADITAAGAINANADITTDGALIGSTATIGGGYGSTGISMSAAGVLQANGAITTDGALTADSGAFGGGYGSTGATISNAGVGQFNGALTTDGALTADSAAIGGGYGSTGVSITNAGALSADGNITGNAYLAGVSNSARGQLIAYGNATTSGALVTIYNGGSNQGNTERWVMGAATDFQISGLGGAQNFGALLTISAATGNVTLAKDLIITGRDAGPADDTDLLGLNANELVVRGTLDATTGIEINNVALAASHLSDGANVAHINAVETLSANWVNTTYPWADNEVADTLTVDSSSTINGVSAANFLAPAYGSMQLASGAVTVASGSTWYTVTGFTQGVLDGSIVSLSTSVFTVGAAGKYEVSIAGKVLSATATDGVSIGLSVNDADPTAATILVSKPAAVVDYRFAATNIIALSATNTVRLKIRNDTDANNVTVSECYVMLKRVGP